ncbi:lipolytic enzyme [Diaporthe helianthi]|uniref:Lipolytic enzyme n=1 Tax=Diaporthe helianthi TaxID=158607 RepID=A0A2P5HWF6_DIAHE|nr:lipolytic enzyme [Diaporthe helianthi]
MVRLSALLPTLSALGSAQAVRLVGRVNPATRELSWSGTGLTFSFTGSSASVAVASSWGTNSIEMVIDNGTPLVLDSISGTSIDTPANLTNGTHTVFIRKRSEGSLGSIYVGDVTTSGTLGDDPAPASKRIQVIGDSITAGYGMDGTYPCVNSASLEDAPNTYGALTAKNLSAEYDIIAWSGKGLVRNVVKPGYEDDVMMPQIWTRWAAAGEDGTYTFPAAETPDVVVVNLGTNDFSYVAWDSTTGQNYDARPRLNATEYAEGLVSFGKTIQGHYPDAELFIASSPLLSDGYPAADDAQKTTQSNAIEDAVARLGSKAHFVNFPPQDSSNNNIGCDYHPSSATHESMAVILTAAIEDVIG